MFYLQLATVTTIFKMEKLLSGVVVGEFLIFGGVIRFDSIRRFYELIFISFPLHHNSGNMGAKFDGFVVFVFIVVAAVVNGVVGKS